MNKAFNKRSQPIGPSAPDVTFRSSRLPYGVSGWVDLSSCHRYLGFGFVVYQRRFFEINWEKRTVSYYNECRTDGDFVYGIGKKKEIQMSSIIRLDFPSTQASRRSGVPYSLGPFDIVTPDRIYTLIPLPPSDQRRSQEESKIRSREQAKIRSYSGTSERSFSESSLFFSCCASPPSLPSPSSLPPPPPPPPSTSTASLSSKTPSSYRTQSTLCSMTTLSARDFQQCIVDSSFSGPREAGGTVAKLLLKRDVNDVGIPWEFECPLTLDIMEDPVVAADGKTYERSAIEEWLLKSNGASIDGSQLPSMKLEPNYRLKEEIAAYTKAKQILRESHNSQRSPRKRTTSENMINWW